MFLYPGTLDNEGEMSGHSHRLLVCYVTLKEGDSIAWQPFMSTTRSCTFKTDPAN